jgi:hypothetical protein
MLTPHISTRSTAFYSRTSPHLFRNPAVPALMSLEVTTTTIGYLRGISHVLMHTLQWFGFTCGPAPQYLVDIRPHTAGAVLNVLKMTPDIDHLELSPIFDVGKV